METAHESPQNKNRVEETLRNLTVLDHLPLVMAIVTRAHENLPLHMDLNDLIRVGIHGLFEAASKNHRGRKLPFQRYAQHRIKVAILDYLRAEFPAKQSSRTPYT